MPYGLFLSFLSVLVLYYIELIHYLSTLGTIHWFLEYETPYSVYILKHQQDLNLSS